MVGYKLHDENMIEQMLSSSSERSETAIFSASKQWWRLINAFKHSPFFRMAREEQQYRKTAWSGVLKSLTHRYPGSQLPEKLISTLRSHFYSLPLSYSQAGFDMEEVFLHVRLLQQISRMDGHSPNVVLAQEKICEASRSSSASELSTCSSVCTSSSAFSEEEEEEEEPGSVEAFKLAFACRPAISRPCLLWSLYSAGITIQELHLFDKKRHTLGVALIQCCKGLCDSPHKTQSLIFSAMQKSRAPKLTLSFCNFDGCSKLLANSHNLNFNCLNLEFLSPEKSLLGKNAPEPYLLNSRRLQLGKAITMGSSLGVIYKGYYNGEMVAVKKLRGCHGLRKDVLALASCHHKNVMPLLGISVDPNRGICLVMKYMDGICLSEAIQKWENVQLAAVLKVATDIVEGMIFLHKRGIVHRHLKSSTIILDLKRTAVLNVLGLINNQSMDSDQYEIGDYSWMAPEVLGSDSESSTMTFMSNVYSFGIILWEMITGQTPFVGYSPVNGAVGVAIYGLRPIIPADCPLKIKHLLERCWASCPLDRPNFFEVLEVLHAVAMEPS